MYGNRQSAASSATDPKKNKSFCQSTFKWLPSALTTASDSYNQSVSESVHIRHVAWQCLDGRISSESQSLHTDLVSEDQSPENICNEHMRLTHSSATTASTQTGLNVTIFVDVHTLKYKCNINYICLPHFVINENSILLTQAQLLHSSVSHWLQHHIYLKMIVKQYSNCCQLYNSMLSQVRTCHQSNYDVVERTFTAYSRPVVRWTHRLHTEYEPVPSSYQTTITAQDFLTEYILHIHGGHLSAEKSRTFQRLPSILATFSKAIPSQCSANDTSFMINNIKVQQVTLFKRLI